jgi:hypothetical protein
MPAYKTYKKTRLGASNVATLEKVYEMTQYPDDAMLASMQSATKLPASKIITWFKEKRTGQKQQAQARLSADRRVEQRGTTGGYSYMRRDEERRSPGMRQGDARDSYGEGSQSRDRRDSSSDWRSS